MTSRRSLVTLLALAALLLVAPSAGAIDTGGGVAVQSFDETGGGILAPAPEPAPAEPPVAEAAQETPTTPEGEEQPPDEEDPPTDEDEPVEDFGEDAPPTGDDGTGGGTDAGALPQTGFELAALSAIGLGLLLAGGALWPTSSWPPPRARLTRSTQRR